MNWFQRFYWTKLSKPSAERPLWKFLLETKLNSILQLGMGNGAQTMKLLRMVSNSSGDAPLRFAGVDLFESAADPQNHLRLKEAHRMLAEAGVKAHLIPGELRGALPRVAVTILPSDLVIINQPFAESAKEYDVLKSWLPRLIHPTSTVFSLDASSSTFVQIQIASISQYRQAA